MAEDEVCPDFKRITLRLDLQDGVVQVDKREQFQEGTHDFNEASSYEICSGVEQVPLASATECSYGNRINGNASNPCMVRIDQRTFKEASEMCSVRGGRLAHFDSVQKVEEIRAFSSRRRSWLGVGLHDAGSNMWRFDGSDEDATDFVASLTEHYGSDSFLYHGCVHLNGDHDILGTVRCTDKFDWICEGTLENRLSESASVVAAGDLMADEGAFCLWHYLEPRDELPNDEGANLANTDLDCSLQVSSERTPRCKYDSATDELVRQRGHYSNKANYPVLGASVGWTGSKADAVFLGEEDAYDRFHCHFTPENSGFLRMYAFQHMFERSYPGAMKRTCGCGYKHMAGLVSRCDCTRSGRGNNNCATWHRQTLIRGTNSSPVRCNNCDNDGNL
jgi:hypothetical protein